MTVRARKETISRSASGEAGQALHVYGVVRRSRRRAPLPVASGIGGASVELTGDGEVAAVTSPAGDESALPRGARLVRALRAHTDVLQEMANRETVLPAAFGVRFSQDELIDWLDAETGRLSAELDRLDGCVELKVSVEFGEEEIVQKILREEPRLRRQAGSSHMEEKVGLGKTIAMAVRTRAEREAELILRRLRPVLEDEHHHAAGAVTVLATSFLARRERVDAADSVLREIDRERGDHLRISCVGPLPPYSFVEPLLKKGENHGIA